MVIPLFVGREKSIQALDVAMRADKRIMLVAQKQADVDDPKADDLYRIGTVATILQLLKLPDGTVVGRRWGRLSRPLVALVLMVLFALLGAAFAASLWGRSRSAPPSDDAGSQILVLGSPVSTDARGIIDSNPDRVETTARDQ